MNILERLKKLIIIDDEVIEEVIEKEIPKLQETKPAMKPQVSENLSKVDLDATLEIVEKQQELPKQKFGVDLEPTKVSINKVEIQRTTKKADKKEDSNKSTYVVKDIISPIYGTSRNKQELSDSTKDPKKTKKTTKVKKEYDVNLNTILSPIYGDKNINHVKSKDHVEEENDSNAVSNYINENISDDSNDNDINESSTLTTLDDILETNDSNDHSELKNSKEFDL